MVSDFTMELDGVLQDIRHVCIPRVNTLRKEILYEAHKSTYIIHLGATKMYQDLKQLYWWDGLKMDAANYVSYCLVCQQVKVEQQRLVRLLQRLEVPK